MTSKIQKVNRIKITNMYRDVRVIYCSADIVYAVREHCIRLNQVLHPKAGENDELVKKLQHLAATKPKHFPKSSLEILGVLT